MDRPPGTVRSRVAGGVAKLRARRAAGRQSGIWRGVVRNRLTNMVASSERSVVAPASRAPGTAPVMGRARGNSLPSSLIATHNLLTDAGG